MTTVGSSFDAVGVMYDHSGDDGGYGGHGSHGSNGDSESVDETKAVDGSVAMLGALTASQASGRDLYVSGVISANVLLDFNAPQVRSWSWLWGVCGVLAHFGGQLPPLPRVDPSCAVPSTCNLRTTWCYLIF